MKRPEELRLVEPRYKVAMPRKEVREGRSFNPDEFVIAREGGRVSPPTEFFDKRFAKLKGLKRIT